MLLHVRPRLLVPYVGFGPCELVDLKIEPFGIYLRGAVQLATRRPYPNKRYLVACRRKGTRAMDGVLIDASQFVQEFTYSARWSIGAETTMSYRITCRLLDNECNAASESMLLWGDRKPAYLRGISPLQAEPLPTPANDGQHFTFSIPTIDRASLLEASADSRVPALGDAFARSK